MKVLVIGDGSLDMFRYGRCERLSPEAPVPIFLPVREVMNGGMAINVMENIKALGVDCDIITNDNRPIKTRLVDEVSNQIIVRIDEKDEVDEVNLNILHNVDFSQYDAVVISDYDKGFLKEEDIEYIAQNHSMVFMDTKKKFGDWVKKIKFIKINEKEYLNNESWLFYNYRGHVIITLGMKGARILKSDGKYSPSLTFEIEKEHPVRDLSGAGDTFLAALVVKYLENNDIQEAIRFANKCASWVVTQKGVVAVDPNQL